jgi:hypothetical protein
MCWAGQPRVIERQVDVNGSSTKRVNIDLLAQLRRKLLKEGTLGAQALDQILARWRWSQDILAPLGQNW